MGKKKLAVIIVVVLVVAGAMAAYLVFRKDHSKTGLLEVPGGGTAQPLHEPRLKTEEIIGGFSNIWDLIFIDTKTAVFDERGGQLHGVNIETKETWDIVTVPNVQAEGEGGLLGLAFDSEFATNRYLYACYNAAGSKRAVKVTRFKLSEDNKSASEFTDIISDIESQAGRHSGCRLTMDTSGHLWVTTGDSAIGAAAQNPRSLAGKVLRVDRDGREVSGNAPAPFDGRIYNYGHRNVQGIVLLRSPLANGAIGLTAEHGPDKQDEINWLMPGNFGWDPNGARSAYDESVPMTDKTKFPDAIDAVWNSGSSTVAVSGMTFLTNANWSEWQGWVAVATLKGESVRFIQINGDGSVKNDKKELTSFGRIRTVVEGPGSNLYLTTDNGGGKDKIIRVIPE